MGPVVCKSYLTRILDFLGNLFSNQYDNPWEFRQAILLSGKNSRKHYQVLKVDFLLFSARESIEA